MKGEGSGDRPLHANRYMPLHAVTPFTFTLGSVVRRTLEILETPDRRRDGGEEPSDVELRNLLAS